MPKKVYAVRKGANPGIYYDWKSCEAQVSGYPGAEYKGFALKSDAEAYLAAGDNNDCGAESETKPEERYDYPLAFTDGSYNPNTKIYGYGGFVAADENTSYEISGAGSDFEKASMRNVAGEIDGAMVAVEKAIELGLSRLTIYYDYKGVAKWADGSWKANKPWTKSYKEFMFKAKFKIDLRFVHVPAHTGVPGNELADAMAKKAVGLL